MAIRAGNGAPCRSTASGRQQTVTRAHVLHAGPQTRDCRHKVVTKAAQSTQQAALKVRAALSASPVGMPSLCGLMACTVIHSGGSLAFLPLWITVVLLIVTSTDRRSNDPSL
jgi:hypothetical protein